MTETDLPDITTLDVAASRGPEGWIALEPAQLCRARVRVVGDRDPRGEFVGDCGLTMQEVDGSWWVEAGWHVRSDLCRQGYATEAAVAVRETARVAGVEHLIAIIRPHNVASQRVAAKVGLVLEREIDKFGGPAPGLRRTPGALTPVRPFRRCRSVAPRLR
ncbi:GNAT family N-acetyltransferase [Nocardioides sp. B-3]|nr:GNAT family N-acetyltransferase [Nocardioides sp. B-3]